MTRRRPPEVPAASPEVEAVLLAYLPLARICSAEEWAEISAFVLEMIRRLQPSGVPAARELLRLMTRFVLHRFRAGIPLDRQAMFSHGSVEEQLIVWRSMDAPARTAAGLRATSLNTEATKFRRLARTLHPTGGFPSKESRGRRADLTEPYEPMDVEGLREFLWNDLGSTRWAEHRNITALGHGVGAGRADAITVLGKHVRASDNLTEVLLRDEAGNAVWVPVAGPYGPWLRDRAEAVGADSPLITPSKWTEGADLYPLLPSYLPVLNCRRLRNTWLADRLAAGCSPTQIRHFGRYNSFSFLTSYARFMPDPPPEHLITGLTAEVRQ